MMKRVLKATARIALTAYLSALALIFAFQRKLVFPVPEPRNPILSDGMTLIKIERGVSTYTTALYWAAVPGNPTIAYFHGNGEQIADTTQIGRALHKAGLGFYAIEYPGYGAGPRGGPTEDGIYAASEEALEHLRGPLKVPTSETILLGYSLGSGVAVEMARRGHGSRVILLAPYTSMVDMAAVQFPWLPVQWLLRDRFDSIAKAKGISVPTLLLHGTRDADIPADMSRKLSQVFPHATIRLLDGAHHADLWGMGATRCVVSFARGDAAACSR